MNIEQKVLKRASKYQFWHFELTGHGFANCSSNARKKNVLCSLQAWLTTPDSHDSKHIKERPLCQCYHKAVAAIARLYKNYLRQPSGWYSGALVAFWPAAVVKTKRKRSGNIQLDPLLQLCPILLSSAGNWLDWSWRKVTNLVVPTVSNVIVSLKSRGISLSTSNPA